MKVEIKQAKREFIPFDITLTCDDVEDYRAINRMFSNFILDNMGNRADPDLVSVIKKIKESWDMGLIQRGDTIKYDINESRN